MNKNKNKRKLNEYQNQNSLYDYDIKKLKLNELIKLGNLRDLNTEGSKKDLIKRILKFDQLVNEENVKINLNSFNKEPPKLNNIKQLSNTEILFWRIFRDKVLFYQIFSFFQFKNIYTYENLSGYRIINYYVNGIEILKDKIKRNCCFFLSHQEFILLFSKLNKIDTVYFFYQLENKFPQYYTPTKENYNSFNLNQNVHFLELFIKRNGLKKNQLKKLEDEYYYSKNIKQYIFNMGIEHFYKKSQIILFLNKNNFTKNDTILSTISILFKELFKLTLKKLFKFGNNLMELLNYTKKIKNINKINKIKFKIQNLQKNINFSREELNLKVETYIVQYMDYKNNLKLLSKYIKCIYLFGKEFRLSLKKIILSEDIKIEDYFNGGFKIKYYYLYLISSGDFFNKKCSINLLDISKLDDYDLFYLELYDTNIEYIESLKNDFSYNNNELIIKKKDFILRNIKTTEQLDFYFTNFNKELFNNNNSNWKYISSLPLLEHYEKLMESKNRKMNTPSIEDYDYRYNINMKHGKMSIEFLYRAINNPKLYVIGKLDFRLFYRELIYYFSNNKIEIIISILKSGMCKEMDLLGMDLADFNENLPGFKYFGMWLINNCKSVRIHNDTIEEMHRSPCPVIAVLTIDIGNNKTIEVSIGINIFFMICIQSGQYEQIIKIIIKEERNRIEHFFNFGYMETHYLFHIPLNFILECIDYYQNKEKSLRLVEFLKKIIDLAPSYLLLPIFKFIILNYGNRISLPFLIIDDSFIMKEFRNTELLEFLNDFNYFSNTKFQKLKKIIDSNL